MNQQQRKYARERVEQIKRRRIQEIKEKHTKKSVLLSPTERLRALKKGEFSVRPGIYEVGTHARLCDVLAFKGERDPSRDDDAIARETAQIEREAGRIVDELMLGDATAALEAIREFDK